MKSKGCGRPLNCYSIFTAITTSLTYNKQKKNITQVHSRHVYIISSYFVSRKLIKNFSETVFFLMLLEIENQNFYVNINENMIEFALLLYDLCKNNTTYTHLTIPVDKTVTPKEFVLSLSPIK